MIKKTELSLKSTFGGKIIMIIIGKVSRQRQFKKNDDIIENVNIFLLRSIQGIIISRPSMPSFEEKFNYFNYWKGIWTMTI